MQKVSSAAPNLKIFYYHIPGSTGARMNMVDLINEVQKINLTQFLGIKYVDDNFWDFYLCNSGYNHTYKIMWANEPKITALPLGAQHSVLAEDFFARTWI